MPVIIYRHTAEAFFKQVLARKGLLVPAFVSKLAALGVDPARPADVEIETWWKVIAIGAEAVAPGLSSDDAHREVGREVVRGFEKSFVGKTSFLVLRLLGHRRAVTKLAESFKSADNATAIEVVESSSHRGVIRYTVIGGHPQPTYTEGILHEGLVMLGARDVSVTHRREAGPAVLFEMSWA